MDSVFECSVFEPPLYFQFREDRIFLGDYQLSRGEICVAKLQMMQVRVVIFVLKYDFSLKSLSKVTHFTIF